MCTMRYTWYRVCGESREFLQGRDYVQQLSGKGRGGGRGICPEAVSPYPAHTFYLGCFLIQSDAGQTNEDYEGNKPLRPLPSLEVLLFTHKLGLLHRGRTNTRHRWKHPFQSRTGWEVGSSTLNLSRQEDYSLSSTHSPPTSWSRKATKHMDFL